MYGMINRAVEELVRGRFGDAAWESVRREAGVDATPFVAMESYPDEVTFRLVEAASQVLGISPAQVFGAVGEHWVLYTAAAENARRAEQALQQRQALLDATNTRLRSILETAADAIITMGADGTVRSFNAAAERIFGYPAAEVVGQPITMLIAAT